jgi:hypothetical protein
VAKGRIDDSIGRNSKNQLARVDPGQQSRFREETIVGCVVQFKDIVQSCVVVRETGKYRGAPVRKLRGDQAMGVALVDLGGGNQRFEPCRVSGVRSRVFGFAVCFWVAQRFGAAIKVWP